MGSLVGHLVPGTFFGIFALWWIINIYLRYFECRFRRLPFRTDMLTLQNCSVASPGSASSKRGPRAGARAYPRRGKLPPIETSLKLTAVLMGMVGEYYTALDDQGRFVSIHNGQHMTMFGFFFFNAFFELLYYYRVPGVPPSLEMVSAAIAFAVEAVLFLWHLSGRTPLDVQVHTFLVYAIVMCFLSVLLELIFKDDVRPLLLRAGFTLLQGTWFYHVGFILYPPQGWRQWKADDHETSMVVTMMFCWNLAAIMVFMFVVGLLVYHYVKRRVLGSSGGLDGPCRGLDDNDYDEEDFDMPECNGYKHLAQSEDTVELINSK